MGIMAVRGLAHRILLPVVIVLALAMVVGVFYLGFPGFMGSSANVTYKGEAFSLDGYIVKDEEFQEYIDKASEQARQYAQYGYDLSFSKEQIMNSAFNQAVGDVAFKLEMDKFEKEIKTTKAEAEATIKRHLPSEDELKTWMETNGFEKKNDLIKVLIEDIKMQKFFMIKGKEFDIKITDEEIKSQFENIACSHILIGTTLGEQKLRTEEEAEKIANEVYAKAIAKGANFGELAKQYSDDPGSKEQKGSLGEMPVAEFKSAMVPEFVAGTLALKKVGEISKPVKSDFGYHIICLDKLPVLDEAAYKKEKDIVERELMFTRIQSSGKFTDWQNQLMIDAKTNVKILDSALSAYEEALKGQWKEAAADYAKAIESKYYKKQWELYISLSKAYIELDNTKEALAILDKVEVAERDNFEYQYAVASVHRAAKDDKKAEEIMLSFGSRNPDSLDLHEKLVLVFNEWKYADAAAKEYAIVDGIEKREAEQLEAYKQKLQESQQEQGQTQETQQQEAEEPKTEESK